jgi:hypothetical protein
MSASRKFEQSAAADVCIGMCCKNKTNTSCGYMWKYLKVIIDEMIADGYRKIATKGLIKYHEGTLLSFITNTGQLRYGRNLVNVENNRFIYTKDDQRFSFQLSNVKEIWIKETNINQ